NVAALIQKIGVTHNRIVEETGRLLDPVKVETSIDMLLKANSIQFYGVGSSGLTAMEAAHSFTRIGKLCDAKQDAHFQAMGASLLSHNDVAVGFSITGSTKDTNENLKIAQQA